MMISIKRKRGFLLYSVLLSAFGLLLYSNFTLKRLPEGFVYLDDYAPGIEIELRYFSDNNFVGDTIDGYFADKCIISESAAKALKQVQKELISKGFRLKVFDAYRPQSAVNHFVRWGRDLRDTKMKSHYYPNVQKKNLFRDGYISSRSGHSRGSTADLTIVYLNGPDEGKEVDMGTPWDFFSPKSWPASNEVTALQKSNRLLLQEIMVKHGFRPYKEEWWHFTLRNEPFPETYFNFPVE
jgi:zinc D-Ala-D-Ala dipeptidase